MVHVEKVGTFDGNEAKYDFCSLSLFDSFNLVFLSIFLNQVYNQTLILLEAINGFNHL